MCIIFAFFLILVTKLKGCYFLQILLEYLSSTRFTVVPDCIMAQFGGILSRPRFQETGNKNQLHCFTGSYDGHDYIPSDDVSITIVFTHAFFYLSFFTLVCQVIPTSHFSRFLRLASCVTCVLGKVTHSPPFRPYLMKPFVPGKQSRHSSPPSSLSNSLIVPISSLSLTPPPCLHHTSTSLLGTLLHFILQSFQAHNFFMYSLSTSAPTHVS